MQFSIVQAALPMSLRAGERPAGSPSSRSQMGGLSLMPTSPPLRPAVQAMASRPLGAGTQLHTCDKGEPQGLARALLSRACFLLNYPVS